MSLTICQEASFFLFILWDTTFFLITWEETFYLITSIKLLWEFWKIILYLCYWKLMLYPVYMFKNKFLNLVKCRQLVGPPCRCPCLYCLSLASGCKDPAANLLMSLFWQDCIAHCFLMHHVAAWTMQHFLELYKWFERLHQKCAAKIIWNQIWWIYNPV